MRIADTERKAVRPVGRLAPSPTGRMHAGNIFAALMSWLIVKSRKGSIVLRIEDLDVERSRREYADQIMRDFESLGITWDAGPFFQQGRSSLYAEMLDRISHEADVYPCFCTRADLKAASAPHRADHFVYPGTCRNLTEEERAGKGAQKKPAWRLAVPDETYALDDLIQGRYEQNLKDECGDFVVRRADGLFAYQLAAVVDDALQGVNLVVRGVDLLPSCPRQMYLQDLLGFGHCTYAHFPLIVSSHNRRLSKRDRDAGMDELLAVYKTPEGIVGHIAAITGLRSADEPCRAEELLETFDPDALGTMFPDPIQIPWRR